MKNIEEILDFCDEITILGFKNDWRIDELNSVKKWVVDDFFKDPAKNNEGFFVYWHFYFIKQN